MTRNKASIPPINWDAENQAPTWGLLNQLEKTENFKVIFGKKNPRGVSPFLTVSWSYSRTPGLRCCSKNTSGDSKIKVFKRIGQVLFPALHAIGCDLRGSLNIPGKVQVSRLGHLGSRSQIASIANGKNRSYVEIDVLGKLIKIVIWSRKYNVTQNRAQ